MFLGQIPMGVLPFTPVTSNPLPVCVDDDAGIFAMGSNQNAINVLANDVNVSGGTLAIVTQPANGVCTVSGTTILYSPNNGWQGSDSFTYRVTTAAGSDTATVTTRAYEGGVEPTDPEEPVDPDPPSAALTAAPDTFRLQTGTTKELWVTWNDVRLKEAQVTSTGQGSSTVTVQIVAGAPAPIAQRSRHYVYNKGALRTRYCRPLMNSSGNSPVVNSITTQPAVGAATRLDASRIQVTVPEAAAPQSTTVGYQMGSANGTTNGVVDLVIQNKPPVTWACGLLIGIPDVDDWTAQIGRAPTANTGFTRLVYRDASNVQHATLTNFSRLSGDNFTVNDAGTNKTVSLFGTGANWMISSFDSGLGKPWKNNAIHCLSVQLVPEDQSVHNSPTGFAKFLAGGAQNSAFTTCWYRFGQRFAVYLDSKAIPSSKVVLELGKECNSTEPYQIMPAWVQDGRDAWKLAIDRIRAGMNNAVPGRADDLRFCFRVAGNRKAVNSSSSLPNLPQLFPGNSHVDVVGFSFHDGETDLHTEQGWHNILFGSDTEFGLAEVYETARQHNVQIGIAEWDLYFTNYNVLGGTKTTQEPREVMERWFRWLYEHRDRLLFETYLSQFNRLRDRWTTWGAAIAYRDLWSN